MKCDFKDFELLLFTVLAYIMVAYSNGDYDIYDYSDRVVILNPRLLDWSEATTECTQINGTLLTVVDASTMYDVGLEGRWIVWVGLKLGDPTSLTWDSGLSVTWTNWDTSPHPTDNNSQCVSLETSAPFRWKTKDCSTKLPSLCEVKTENPCNFQMSKRSSLIGFTNDYLVQVNLIECRNNCTNATTSYRCLSFEYNEKRQICQLSETNRWIRPREFTTNDPEWDYYHLDCYSIAANYSISQPYTSLMEYTTMPTSTTTTEEFCFSLEDLLPSENATRQIEMVIQELKELQVKYKKRRLTLKKESVPDHRPSARYMGGAALIVIVTLLGIIILLDALTFTKQCCRKAKKKKNKKYSDLANEIVRQAGRSILAERKLALSAQHLVLDYSKSKMVNVNSSLDEKEDTGSSSISTPIENHLRSNGVRNHTYSNNSCFNPDWIIDENFENDEDIEKNGFQTNNVADKDLVNSMESEHGSTVLDELPSSSTSTEHEGVEDLFPSHSRHSHSNHTTLSSNFSLSFNSYSGRNDSSNWHNTTMAGSPYTMLPFKSRRKSWNKYKIDNDVIL